MKQWLAAALAAALSLSAHTAPLRDGSHDFDFNIGTWRTHLVRLKHPLSGSTETVTLDGTVSFGRIWGGRGLYEQVEAEGSGGHWEGMTWFLYDRAAGQWSQRFVGSRSGQFQPTMFGGFRGGEGELVAHDSFDGRAILVRGRWSGITPDAHRYEEAYSTDGGRTWETVIRAALTRIAPVPQPAFPASSDGAHDFDFDQGLWRTRSSRLVKPLTGSTEWTELEGATRVTPIWGGRANLAEFAADGPSGHVELISLRLFDPAARQWSLNFATAGQGRWSLPMIGGFKDGRGEFYDQEEYGGRMILVRFTFASLSPDEARSEQAFSADGGRTWETNWINRYTRIGAGPRG